MPAFQNLTSRRWQPSFYKRTNLGKSVKWPYGAINLSTMDRLTGKPSVTIQELKLTTLSGYCGPEYWEWNCEKGWVFGGPDGKKA